MAGPRGGGLLLVLKNPSSWEGIRAPALLPAAAAGKQAGRPLPQPGPGREMDRAGPTAISAPSGIRRLCPDRQASWCAIVWLKRGRPEREASETHPSQQPGSGGGEAASPQPWASAQAPGICQTQEMPEGASPSWSLGRLQAESSASLVCSCYKRLLIPSCVCPRHIFCVNPHCVLGTGDTKFCHQVPYSEQPALGQAWSHRIV